MDAGPLSLVGLAGSLLRCSLAALSGFSRRVDGQWFSFSKRSTVLVVLRSQALGGRGGRGLDDGSANVLAGPAFPVDWAWR